MSADPLKLVFVDTDDSVVEVAVWDRGFPLYHYRLLMQVRVGDRLPAFACMRVFIDQRPVAPLPEYVVPPGAGEVRFTYATAATGKRFQRAA